jgi:flavorubredoxin
VDTVKYDFSHVTIDNIKRIVDPAKIRHIVINHIENDHVTSIDKIMALTPDATIHITERGKKGLDRFFDTSKWNMHIVKTGDTLKIGRRTLLFIETPMLHWPDSMMTYCQEDRIFTVRTLSTPLLPADSMTSSAQQVVNLKMQSSTYANILCRSVRS